MTNAKVDKEGNRLHPIEESPNRKGDIAEHYVMIWLWETGYEVYKNAGCSGSVDLISKKDGKVILIDVKTRQTRNDRPPHVYSEVTASRTKEQKDEGVQIVAFHPITKKCHFMKHKD